MYQARKVSGHLYMYWLYRLFLRIFYWHLRLFRRCGIFVFQTSKRHNENSCLEMSFVHMKNKPHFFLRSICLSCLLFIGYLFWIMTWTFSFLNSYNNHKNIVMVNTATIFCVHWVQLSWEGGIYDNHCLSFLFIRKAHNEEVLCVYTKNRNPFSHVHLSVRVVYFLYFYICVDLNIFYCQIYTI